VTASGGEILRHEIAWLPVEVGQPRTALAGQLVWVLNGDEAFRQAVGEAFVAVGATVLALDDRDEPPGPADPAPHLIIDGGIGPDGGAEPGWQDPLARTVATLQAVYGRWATAIRYGSVRYLAVVWRGPGETPPADAHGIWSGIAKTLPREIAVCRSQVLTLGGVPGCGATILAALGGTDLIELAHDKDGFRTPVPVPRPVPAEARITLDSSDVVVLTGGARGIGFSLALALAVGTGCRIIVSGREDVDAERDRDWARASDEEFARDRSTAFRSRPGGVSLPALRAEYARRSRIREIASNLRRARHRGARIDYVRCDVTDAGSVAALIRAAGPGLSAVIHNAGIDMPARLAGKTLGQIEAVIAVKLTGLRLIRRALRNRPLKVLCLTGSLTGRYGGMVGQVDYSAANETLAFAARALTAGPPTARPDAAQVGYPVLCVAWPTWDGIGLITNMAAAARYMKPISESVAIRDWIAELLHATAGEVAFMGDFAAVSAQHLTGVPIPSSWPGARRMLSRRHFLGEVLDYAPTRSIRSRHRIDPATAPYLGSALVAGRPAMPVTAVLEYLLASRDGFLVDLDGAAALRDVTVDVEALVLTDGAAVLDRTARLLDDAGSARQLEVGLDRLAPDGTTRRLARAVLVVADGFVVPGGTAGEPVRPPLDPPPGRLLVEVPAGEPRTAAAGLHYAWPELATLVRAEAPGGPGAAVLTVDPYPVELAFTTPLPPLLAMPTAAVEAALGAGAGPEGATRLRIAWVGPAGHPADARAADARADGARADGERAANGRADGARADGGRVDGAAGAALRIAAPDGTWALELGGIDWAAEVLHV
jgi:NAD(P)-dependent dehydrogenase (short-subunit alcohol dehydrogenase family)